MSPGPRASESGVLLGLEGQRGSHHLLTPTPCTTSDRILVVTSLILQLMRGDGLRSALDSNPSPRHRPLPTSLSSISTPGQAARYRGPGQCHWTVPHPLSRGMVPLPLPSISLTLGLRSRRMIRAPAFEPHSPLKPRGSSSPHGTWRGLRSEQPGLRPPACAVWLGVGMVSDGMTLILSPLCASVSPSVKHMMLSQAGFWQWKTFFC